MAPQMRNYEISWTQFESCNQNPQVAFEKMCRWLFNDFFFDGKALLHSNPNNPGVEVLPKLHAASNKRISFQAKFFSSMDYEQIKHSARKTVEYYSGEIDVVYLYCNKDVMVTSDGYQAAVNILSAVGIDLIPITNQEILEQVMKNETISWHFFNYTSLSAEWFQNQLETSLASLGPRYNDQFNVSTSSENLFKYFLCNDEAVFRINQDKNDLIEELRKDRWKYRNCQNILQKIIVAIEGLGNICVNNILDCLQWSDILKSNCAVEFAQINELIEKKKTERSVADSQKNRQLASRISEDIDALWSLLRIPQRVLPENYARILMRNQILVVKGKAGVGKSQMFAVKAENLIKAGHGVILLLGTSYLSRLSVEVQTLETLALNLSLDALFHKLEALGIQNGIYSYIFIDGINESVYKDIWKTGMHHLCTRVKKYPHIKIAVSVRSGYERIVFNDAVNKLIADGDVASIVHNGFQEESINATLTFLNHYGIPFLPSYFLQSEMTNPLFLKMFCETYSGENFDMFSLFDKLIQKADKEAQTAVGITDQISVLNNMVDELATIRLEKDSLTITQTELFDLDFWERFDLPKIPFVASLERSGLLISMAANDTESYFLGYNLLEDFVCARTILKKHKEKAELVCYLQKELLNINNGRITNYHNIDIFIVVCGLFADRYHEECFEDVEMSITDEFEKDDIIERYLTSFMWRKASSVDSDSFLAFLRQHTVNRDTVFRILIENSTKEHHPLNASFLHSLLLHKSLCDRDALWTTFINSLSNEKERVFQLITYFDEGNLLDGLSHTNAELLLILFCWLLTSSNRFLRDKASKAAIELLKHHFTLSKDLLKRFETVNDPYVFQRLYGIVFGACVKRTELHKEAFRDLATYVFASVFNQESVYPDILLRDFARLILERWRHEYPAESEFIDSAKIMPPYKSAAIPNVERQEYYKFGSDNGGFNSIDLSMRINHCDCPGLYGDFGRYTFQSALEHFDGVDVVNLYHYAMQYIRDELGYDDLLGEYDSSSRYYRYSRHDTKKVERIGKKYQWIAFYNILARVSDTYLVKSWDEESYSFQGPWDPYVRDFDPTLNRNSLFLSDAPDFNICAEKNEFLPQDPTPTLKDIQKWKYTEPEFFNSFSSKLSINDTSGISWSVLYLYESVKNKLHTLDTTSIGFAKGSQQIWAIAEAYFVRPTQISALRQHIVSSDYSRQDFPEGEDVYQLFNREYTWSPGYSNIFREPWIDYEINTGKYRIEKEIYEIPDFEHVEMDDEGNMIFPMIEKEFERKIPEDVLHVQIMPTCSRVLWEEQYDASQDESTSFYVPCRGLIEHFGLEQKQADGYYYTKGGVLVCFDSSLSGAHKGLLIRTDFLEKYLKDNDVQLLWTCIGEKQYFLGDLHQEWSQWKGCYHMENGKICGKLDRYEPTS